MSSHNCCIVEFLVNIGVVYVVRKYHGSFYLSQDVRRIADVQKVRVGINESNF